LLNTTGNNNSFYGYNAGNANVSGSSNTAIGNNADFAEGGFSNVTVVGNGSVGTASNQVRIGNAAVGSIGGFANWTNISDGRFKNNIREDVSGLAFIMQLRPVTYNLDINAINVQLRIKGSNSDAQPISDKQLQRQSGFIAQEVEAAAKKTGYEFSAVDAPKNNGDMYGLRYAEFVVPLVKAVQEQQLLIQQLQKEIDQLKKQTSDKKEF
jgi:hypothetical protein